MFASISNELLKDTNVRAVPQNTSAGYSKSYLIKSVVEHAVSFGFEVSATVLFNKEYIDVVG